MTHAQTQTQPEPRTAQRPGLFAVPGVTMTRSAYELADLDQQIADAQTRLTAARATCRRSANGATIQAVHDAVAVRDELLEQRFAIQPRQPSWRS